MESDRKRRITAVAGGGKCGGGKRWSNRRNKASSRGWEGGGVGGQRTRQDGNAAIIGKLRWKGGNKGRDKEAKVDVCI